MNEEVMRVLKMLEEGKISADKAKEIIDALGNSSTQLVVNKNYEDKFLKVKVLSVQGDRVNIQLPIKVIREVLKVTGQLPITASIEGMEGVDVDQLINTIVSCLDNEVMGEIVDIYSAKGDTVKVVIE